jgi:hypothetical protein
VRLTRRDAVFTTMPTCVMSDAVPILVKHRRTPSPYEKHTRSPVVMAGSSLCRKCRGPGREVQGVGVGETFFTFWHIGGKRS